MMKITAITLLSLIILFFITQAFMANSTSKIETLKYNVIKSYDKFEIRKYKSANFSYIKMNANSYKESSGKGFRALAGYIFGGNESSQKIAMTSPVKMELDDSITMKFMIPSNLKPEELPKPDNKEVKFTTEPEKIVAAIRFGGWANDNKIENMKKELIQLLKENDIKHTNKFSYFGYNPPYEVINRRNEIIVELDKNFTNGI
ncbi:SOUL family heme-binding protein [Vicingus serpentipes]|nr:heme-binding protein [Vicingus serpentipes]